MVIPVFLMLSGALLLNRNYAIYEFIKRRFPRILKPFIFWMSIALVFGIIAQDKFSIFSSMFIAISYIVKTFLANRWYVWMIIGVYLVMPIINDFVKNRGLKGIEYFLSLLVITSIIYSLSLYFHYTLYYLDLGIFVGPLAYVLLGYYIHNKEFNLAPVNLVILGLAMFVFAVLVKTILVYLGHFNLSMFFYYSYLSKSYIEIDIFAQFYFRRYFSRDKRAEYISERVSKLLKIDCATWINMEIVGYSRVTHNGTIYYSNEKKNNFNVHPDCNKYIILFMRFNKKGQKRRRGCTEFSRRETLRPN